MLRRTTLCRVVFTEGFPFLEIFAHRYFLPEHPLRHSNLWLDEDDFTSVQHAAKARGVPMPLQINPYAHHPRLSPYATSSSSSSAAGGRRQKSARGRPPRSSTGTTSLADKHDTPTEGPYRVPICATTVYRHLHLYNADQMMLTDHRVLSSTVTPARGGHFSGAAPFVLPDQNAADVMQDGVRALRALLAAYPTVPGQHYSVELKKPYHIALNSGLEHVRARQGFTQRWWGTHKQWTRLGATLLPRQLDNCVAIPTQTKLVHISLLTNPEALLASSVIFAKSGRLHYLFASASGSDAVARPSQDVHDGVLRPQHDDLSSSPAVLPEFFARLLSDMRTHGYPMPLYTTSSQLARSGWTLKPNSMGVATTTPQSPVSSELDHTAIPEALETFTDGGDASTSTRVRSHRPKHEPGPLDDDDDASSAMADHAMPAASTRTRSVFFYHLSQIHLPEPFFFPPTVISAELEHPIGTPVHGMTGIALPFDALRAAQLAVEQPQLAALLSTAPDGLVSVNAVRAFDVALGLPSGHFHTLAPPPRGTTTTTTAAQARAQSSRAELEALLDEAADTAAPTPTETTPTQSAGRHADNRADVVEPGQIAAPMPTAAAPLCALKDLVGDDEASLAHFVASHADPTKSRGRQLWFLATDVLNANGVVDVNAAPVEVTVVGEEVVPGYRLGPNGLEPVSAVALSNTVDGAGNLVPAKRFFNVALIENAVDVYRSVNTAPPP